MNHQWPGQLLDELDRRSLRRRLTPVHPVNPVEVMIDGRHVVLFSSNDYLGLSTHPAVIERINAAVEQFGMGPRGASLLCGYTMLHKQLEERLAEFKGSETALLFPTGYMANLGILQAFGGAGTAIFSDELNHASIIDGCRLSRSDVNVYRHCDMEHLRSLLKASQAARKIIITDALFSMDGDIAPLVELAEIKTQHNCMLILDEAHSTLLYGQTGKGLAEQFGIADKVDVQMGTLSKAFASIGGYAATRSLLHSVLVNRARSFIFTTALPVPCIAAAIAVIEIVQSDPGPRRNLMNNIMFLREKLHTSGIRTVSQEPETLSPIFPIIIGDAEQAMMISDDLLRAGMHVPAIRPPTVPERTSRLRLSVTAAHSDAQLLQVANALQQALAPI